MTSSKTNFLCLFKLHSCLSRCGAVQLLTAFPVDSTVLILTPPTLSKWSPSLSKSIGCPLNVHVNTMSSEWSCVTWQVRTILSPTVTSMLEGGTMTLVGSGGWKQDQKKKKVESKRMKYWVVSLYFFAGYGLQTSVTWEAGIQARRSFLIWNDENTHYENLSRATEPRWGALRVAHLRRPWKGLPLPTGSEIDSLKRFQISPASVEAIFQLSANRKVHAHLKFVGLFFPPYPKSDKCLVWEI